MFSFSYTSTSSGFTSPVTFVTHFNTLTFSLIYLFWSNDRSNHFLRTLIVIIRFTDHSCAVAYNRLKGLSQEFFLFYWFTKTAHPYRIKCSCCQHRLALHTQKYKKMNISISIYNSKSAGGETVGEMWDKEPACGKKNSWNLVIVAA